MKQLSSLVRDNVSKAEMNFLDSMEFNFRVSLQVVQAPDAVLVLLAAFGLVSEVAFGLVLFSKLARRLLPLCMMATHLGILFLQNILFPDLILMPINTEPTGTLVIIGTDPTNNELWPRYDVLADWILNNMKDVHPDILDRDQCFDPHDPIIGRVMGMLRHSRQFATSDPEYSKVILDRIRHLVNGSMPRRVAP